MLGRLARAADRSHLRALLAAPANRARVAVIGLLLVCAGNAYVLRDVARLVQPARPLDWDPRVYAERFAGVRELLPADAQLGYVNPALRDDTARRQDLFATRYALIPQCVVAGADEQYVLQGDRSLPVDDTHATIRDDSQHGWRLIERAAPR